MVRVSGSSFVCLERRVETQLRFLYPGYIPLALACSSFAVPDPGDENSCPGFVKSFRPFSQS